MKEVIRSFVKSKSQSIYLTSSRNGLETALLKKQSFARFRSTDIGVLIGIVVTIVIGVALIPVVTDTIDSLDTSTMQAALVSLIKILPIIVVTLLIVGAVGYFAYMGQR